MSSIHYKKIETDLTLQELFIFALNMKQKALQYPVAKIVKKSVLDGLHLVLNHKFEC